MQGELSVPGVEGDMVAHGAVEMAQPSHGSVEMVENSGIIETCGTADVLSSEAMPMLESDVSGSDLPVESGKVRRAVGGLAVLPDPESSDQDASKQKPMEESASSNPSVQTVTSADGTTSSDLIQVPDGQQVLPDGQQVQLIEGVAGINPGDLPNGQMYSFITPDGYAVPFYSGGAVPVQSANGQVA